MYVCIVRKVLLFNLRLRVFGYIHIQRMLSKFLIPKNKTLLIQHMERCPIKEPGGIFMCGSLMYPHLLCGFIVHFTFVTGMVVMC